MIRYVCQLIDQNSGSKVYITHSKNLTFLIELVARLGISFFQWEGQDFELTKEDKAVTISNPYDHIYFTIQPVKITE